MWAQCTIDKILPVRQITGKNGEFKLREIDLDFVDYDAEGKPCVDSNGHYIHSKVRVSAFDSLLEFIDSNNLVVGQYIWAEFHFNTENREDRNGNWWTSNKIYLKSLRLN